MIFFSSPVKTGEGDHAKHVEGAAAVNEINSSSRCLLISLFHFYANHFSGSETPSTALRAVPLPRYRGGGCRVHPLSFLSTTQAPPAAISLLQKLSR
jgi:hypothetical protein